MLQLIGNALEHVFFWLIVPLATFSIEVGCFVAGATGFALGVYRTLRGNSSGWIALLTGCTLLLIGTGLGIFLTHFYLAPLALSSK